MINVNAFFRVAIKLAFKGCSIIREIAESPEKEIFLKGENNPVTEADFKVQSLLTKGLRSVWPSLKIIGQESQQVYSMIDSTNSLDNYSSTKAFFQGDQTQLNLSRVCVWIDPLDGTFSFCQGDLDDVTILIGLSYDNKAKLGVIVSPYSRSSTNKIIFQPKAFFGTVDFPIIYEMNYLRSVQAIEVVRSDKKVSVLASKYRSERQNELLSSLSDNIIPQGGCGRKVYSFAMKIIKLIYNEANAIINLSNKSSKWDICAGEALVRAMGGTVTNLRGQEIVYDSQWVQHANSEGLVCAVNTELSKKIITSTNEFVIL